MIIVIDNYDSFTYNLVQYLGELAPEFSIAADLRVYRNDQITLSEIRQSGADAVLISPGPGRPEDAGISVDLIRELGPTLPILGVCLGHQAIAEYFGGKVAGAKRLIHGETSEVEHSSQGIFVGIPTPFRATRYHSLSVREMPDDLVTTARSDDGEVMGLMHESAPIHGVQFHPESVLTEHGYQLLQNWLDSITR